jgi:CMP-N-acetylneuraminic acid synthetase
MKVLALIPARGGSKEVPRKNIKKFNGKPLIAHSIEVAFQAQSIDRVVVSTDDENIAEIAKMNGAEVPFLRPPEISGDKASDNQFLRHAINWFKNHNEDYSVIVLLRPTCLFRTSDDIDKAVQKLSTSGFDSVRSISRVGYSPYWMKKKDNEKLVSFLDSDFEYSPRQSLPDVYQANGAVDVLRSSVIMNHEIIYGENIGFIELDELSRTDIDTGLDFKIAEFLYKNYWDRS